MSWNNVDVGFEGEETTMFGARNESGTALYQVETFAMISPQEREEVIRNPKLFACSCQSCVCVVADNDLSVFDGNGQQFKFTISFDSEVDVVTWSNTAAFLVVAERDGTIHIVDVQSEEILFAQTLVDNIANGNEENGIENHHATFNNIMLDESNCKGSYNLVISTENCGCFVFSNILLDQLCQALHNGDAALAQKVKESIQMEQISTSNIHTESTNYAITFDRTGIINLLTAGKGTSSLAIWYEQEDTMQPFMTAEHITADCAIVKCRVDGKRLYALDEQHCLSLWDLRFLTTIAYWSEMHIQDFILSAAGSVHQTKNNGLGSHLKLIVLTVSNPQCFVKVYSLPTMEAVYSLEVAPHSTLVNAPISQDGIFLVEGVLEDNDYEFISTLRLRCLMEAQPETRFHRLLRKKRFDEALKFAKQFALDIELVYKVKSDFLLDKTTESVSHQDIDVQQLFSSLKDCLENISDIDHIVQTCTLASFPTYQYTIDLLNYAKSRVLKWIGTKSGHCSSTSYILADRMTEVMKIKHRLDTFIMAYGEKKFSSSRWNQFVDTDLLSECIRLLTEGSICTAATIWQRHQSEFEEHLSSQALETVLSSIPEDTKSANIIPWFRDDLIPFMVRRLPERQVIVHYLLRQDREETQRGRGGGILIM
ncbi:kinetochore-associated protein 1-like [Glandiceps talaboti]